MADQTLRAMLDALTEDTSPDAAADFVITKDTSASLLKKVKPSNLGYIGGSTGATDNAILRADGTAGKTAQSSGAVVNDSGYVGAVPAAAIGGASSEVPVFYGTTDTNSGLGIHGSDSVSLIGGGYAVALAGASKTLQGGADFKFGWNSSGNGAFGAGADTALERSAAGVVKVTNASTGVRGFIGGGAAVASATALPLPTGRVFHVTGTTTITSITATNLEAGVVITIIFDGILTFTDGNNLKLAGNFVTTADDTITLAYDGTNFYETSRSIN